VIRRRVTAPRPAAAAALLIALTLVACGPAGGSVSPSVGASPSETEPTVPSQASLTPEPTTQATDDLGAFVCDLPIDDDGTVSRAQITDVRIGTHAGYDRVVIEFDEGIPPFILDEATPPLLADPSGMEMDVEGDAFWSLVLQGGTRVGLDGSMTYDGQTDFTPEFPALAELVEAGDFEAVSSWYIGLQEASCARVLTLADPSRLVIDIEHP
jgi:hypothetical protein